MKCAIDMPGGTISSGKRSHKAAWAYLRAYQLKHEGVDVKVIHKGESWDDYDRIYLYHGMEFQGALNLFGGANDKTASLFSRLIDYKGELVSLDIPMPDYGELCKGRLKSCEEGWKNTDWDAVSARCKNIPAMRNPNISDHLVMGDSHSFSVYVPGAMVARMDCKTFHGMLQMNVKDLVELNLATWEIPNQVINKLTLYFGNIDVRHHLCRFAIDLPHLVEDMVVEYERQIKKTKIPNIEIAELLPIENESRKLPKTGYYKGQPFHGTWAERNKMREFFNSLLEAMCARNRWFFYRHPKEILNEKGELSFDAMESPRSVHLSPEFYRTNLYEKKETQPEDSFFSEFFENE